MKTNKLSLLFISALALGAMTACSSSDDADGGGTDIVTPTLSSTFDDVTADMASTLYNNKTVAGASAKGLTRSVLTKSEILPEIPTWPGNTAVPSEYTVISDTHQNANSGSGNNYLVPAGETLDNFNFYIGNSCKIFVQGTARLSADNGHFGTWANTWNNTGGTIIVKEGGKLIIDTNGNLIGSGGTIIVEKGATLEFAENTTPIIASVTPLYVDGDIIAPTIELQTNGTLYVNGDLNVKGFNGKMNASARVYVAGKMTSADDLYTDGYLRVASIEAPNITFQSATHLISECSVVTPGTCEINSNETDVHLNYLKCQNLNQCAGSTLFLGNKGYIDVEDTYSNLNNGNNAAITMEGEKAFGVLKATTIAFNGSGSPSTLNDCYFAQTPEAGQRLGIDCENWNFMGGTSTPVNVPQDSIDFIKGTVVHITNGKVRSNDGQTEEKVTYSIPDDACHGGGYVPGYDVDDPTVDVVSESHTHDISATCVQYYNGKAYVSYHKRGEDRSGCLEVLSTTGDQTSLVQFVRDHNNSIDFNHVMIDADNSRLYTVGNNKNGGFLGFMDINADGKLNCESTKFSLDETIDSTDIDAKTYYPLTVTKLWQAKLAASGNAGTKNGGDGNAVILNHGVLQVASTFGLENFDQNLNRGTIKQTPGKAKHIALTPDGDVILNYFTSQDRNSEASLGLKLEKYKGDDTGYASPVFSVDANTVAPNNGKNTICEYDGKIYVCQSKNGLYVYDASTGAQVGHYKENITSEKTGNEMKICANGVAVDSKYVYIAYGTRGLIVLNRADLVGEVGPDKKVTSFVANRSANYVTLANGYIYVAYGRNCLRVFKLVE